MKDMRIFMAIANMILALVSIIAAIGGAITGDWSGWMPLCFCVWFGWNAFVHGSDS